MRFSPRLFTSEMTMTDIPDHNVITIHHLVELLKRHAVEEFWNVLADDDFTGELIPGSRRVPSDRVARESARLPRDTAIVVYCSNARSPHSRYASTELTVLGFRNVRVFEGGLAAWKASGRGVETLFRSATAVP
jgi:rhodanese-related sulfurtransferase